MNRTILCLLACCAACTRSDDTTGDQPIDSTHRGFDSPVALNAEAPVLYPPTLFDQGLEGTVVLQLFANERGEIVPDSTRIAEGSGFAEFDEAALAGVAVMRFAPARRDGVPVATSFLQPVHFRVPEGTSTGG
jgi:protein TonB